MVTPSSSHPESVPPGGTDRTESLSARFERLLKSCHMERPDGEDGGAREERDAAGLSGTKLKIAEAALETLKANGFAGASARAIAHIGGFNQALIFYHFGSVQSALLAALDLISDRRLAEYGPAFEAATTA